MGSVKDFEVLQAASTQYPALEIFARISGRYLGRRIQLKIYEIDEEISYYETN